MVHINFWNILQTASFVLTIVQGCEQIVFKEGILVTWFTSVVTGRCMNVVPQQSEWYTAVSACRNKLGDLATFRYSEEEQQLYEIIKTNTLLQNWTFWINASHANASDVYFKVQRNMDQIVYVPYGASPERKGFICEYDLMNPAKRIAVNMNDPTLLQFLGCYLGFSSVLLSGTIGMVAYINNRRKKAYENYYYKRLLTELRNVTDVEARTNLLRQPAMEYDNVIETTNNDYNEK